MTRMKWFVGVDWGSRTHQACILDGAGAVRGERAFKHGGAGLAAMAAWIDDTAGDTPAAAVGVAIETPRGPVAESLLAHGLAVHSINPKQLDRFRDRHSPAGAKDDRRDARVLASALRTDPQALHRVEATDPVVVELREWSRIAADLARERRRLANRLREQLWRYYPQFNDAVDDPAAPWALALWERVPNPAAARGVRVSTYDKVLKKHGIRRFDGAALKNRLSQRPLDVDPAAVRAAEAHVRLLAKRLAVLNDQIAEAKTQLEAFLGRLGNADPEPGAGGEPPPGQAEEQRDVTILRSLPGVGTVVSRRAVRGGARRPAPAGLPRAALPVRGGAGHPAVRPAPDRDPAPGRPRPAARRRLPLGPRRGAARSGVQGPLRRPARARPQSRPLAAFRRRPPPERRLRHAARPDAVRPAGRHARERRVPRIAAQGASATGAVMRGTRPSTPAGLGSGRAVRKTPRKPPRTACGVGSGAPFAHVIQLQKTGFLKGEESYGLENLAQL